MNIMASDGREADTNRPWLSVVLPFYRKLAEFERVLPMNAGYWARPGIEVVLALDEPSEEAGVLALVARFPQIRWKVLVNDVAHAWRPPCKAINAGVRGSAGRFVLVHSPESAYASDAPALLLHAAMGHARGVAVGRVGFARFDELTDTLDTVFARQVPPELLLQTFYGSLCCAREAFEAVHGYDESFEEWGGDDDNLRVRLEMAGWQLLACPDAHLLHLSDETRTGGEQFERDVDWIKCTPHEARAGDAGWGCDFDRIARDDSTSAWSAEAPHWPAAAPVVPMGSRRQCEVCARLLHHEPSAFHCPRCARLPIAPRLTSRLRIVCVLQVRNEARCLPGCLDHLRGHVDGIVALDDGSTDGTADILRREPMLLELLSNPPCDDGAHVWRENENKRRLLEAARRHGAGCAGVRCRRALRSAVPAPPACDRRFAAGQPACQPVARVLRTLEFARRLAQRRPVGPQVARAAVPVAAADLVRIEFGTARPLAARRRAAPRPDVLQPLPALPPQKHPACGPRGAARPVHAARSGAAVPGHRLRLPRGGRAGAATEAHRARPRLRPQHLAA